MNNKNNLITLLFINCLAMLFNANAEVMPVEKYQKAEQQLAKYTDKLLVKTVDEPLWRNNHSLVYKSRTKNGVFFFTVDVNTKKKRLAFDHKKLTLSLNKLTKEALEYNNLPLESMTWPNDNAVIFNIEDQQYRCEVKPVNCQIYQPYDVETESISPNGKYTVFIKNHNLWLRDLTTNNTHALTTDGIENFGYSTNNAGWERSDKPVVKWAPNSAKLTTFKHDSRKVGEMAVVSTKVGHPDIDVWKYPLPGDEAIFTIKRVVIDIKNKKVIELDMPADAQRSTITDHIADDNGDMFDIDWAEDSSHFAFVSTSRDQKTATLKIADANTGKVRNIFEENQQTFFESGVASISWRYLDQSNEFIWFSQRSDWGHFYLLDGSTGKIKHQITNGDWTVIELLHVNQQTGKLIFTGAGREGGDPYFHYLYSINKNGADLTLLTPEKKHHRITLNNSGEYFLDRVSTPTQAEISFIRSTAKNTGFIVEQSNINKLLATGWQAPTPFIVKDRNGENDIYGLMYKPSDFDETKSYPVINYLYPGPQVGSIRGRHFRSARGDNQAIAELGFIVIEIDALGTPGRSKSFHDFYYGNMGDSGIPDQVAAIKQLAKRYSWIDDKSVGIWGHSGGGFASTRALLLYPDFYSVAVSQAGNHDNRNYEDIWGEKYHGLLEKNDDGTDNYDSQANQLLVDNLKGKLLIAHGTLDTNVSPYNTLLVVDALIAANKDFDMLMLPNRGHGFARKPYMMRKRWDYFVKHLLGVTPPKEYKIYNEVKP